MKKMRFVLCGFIYTGLCFAQNIPDGPCLGQTPPDKIMTRFAPGIISKSGRTDYYVSFSPSGTEMYYGTNSYISYTESKDNR